MFNDLVLSIVFSALLFVILRLFPVMGVITFNGIVVNYFTAATWSLFFSEGQQFSAVDIPSFLPVALFTGAMFIIVFFITGLAAQRTGVAVASVASKMSMVIPVLAGLWLYQEQLHTTKLIGILMAFPAVFLVSKPSSKEELKNFRFQDLGLPILLFFGAGLVDTLIKAVQFYFMNEQNKGIIIMMIFGSAGTIGLVRLIYLSFKGQKFISTRDFVGGIVLGSANFLSLHFLVKCLEFPGAESSHVFTIVNTGVVSLSAVIAAIGFREKFSSAKILGLMLAIGAIVVLSLNV